MEIAPHPPLRVRWCFFDVVERFFRPQKKNTKRDGAKTGGRTRVAPSLSPAKRRRFCAEEKTGKNNGEEMCGKNEHPKRAHRHYIVTMNARELLGYTYSTRYLSHGRLPTQGQLDLL